MRFDLLTGSNMRRMRCKEADVIFSILGEFLNLIDVLSVQLGDILSKMSLNLLQNPHGFGTINKINSKAMLSKSASPSNSVEVGFT